VLPSSYKALWGKTLFFVSMGALIVAGANSEINPIVVEESGAGGRMRCEGPGITFLPQARTLILDGSVRQFRTEDVKGRFPGRVSLRDALTGESFLIRADSGWASTSRYVFDQVSNPNFKIRLLDCEGNKDVM
jgi:hypothetical protein